MGRDFNGGLLRKFWFIHGQAAFGEAVLLRGWHELAYACVVAVRKGRICATSLRSEPPRVRVVAESLLRGALVGYGCPPFALQLRNLLAGN